MIDRDRQRTIDLLNAVERLARFGAPRVEERIARYMLELDELLPAVQRLPASGWHDRPFASYPTALMYLSAMKWLSTATSRLAMASLTIWVTLASAHRSHASCHARRGRETVRGLG